MLSWNTLSCSVLPLSFRFSIWAKHPQNLLVSLWIVDHQLFKESLVRLNFLSLWKVDQILSQNVVCFWSVDITASKLTLSHTDTSLMSSSMVKLFLYWLLLVVDFFLQLGGGGVQIVPFQLGVEIDGHWRLNAEWTSNYYYQNLVHCLVKCQWRRDFDFVSPSPNKHQSNLEAALISNKIENKKEKALFNIDLKV